MSSGQSAEQVVETGENTGRILHLYHRRRGWSWVGFGSLIGVVVYFIIGIFLFGGVTGPLVLLTFVPLLVLPVLTVVGLVAAFADTIRLHRFGGAERAAAHPKRVRHPAYEPTHRMPRRHTPSWVAALIMVVVMAGLMVALVPAEVNDVAYLVGAGHQDTFHSLQVRQRCGKSGCHLVSEGYLANTGARVELGHPVPAGTTAPVRDPWWSWGTGRDPVDGTGSAVGTLIGSLFFNALFVLLFWYLVSTIKTRRRGERQERTARLGKLHSFHGRRPPLPRVRWRTLP